MKSKAISRYLKINVGQVGALQELRVTCDLLKKGFEVYRNISQHGVGDLVAFKNGTTFLIDVKSVLHISADGRWIHNKSKHNVPYYALITKSGKIKYLPDFT